MYYNKRKYNNNKIIIDDIKFDSNKEARRYKELLLLQKLGKISNLELQPHFLLQDSFKYNNKTYRKIEYIADFKYFDKEANELIVEDVKGFKTDIYKLKKKLFIYKYKMDIKEL